MFPLQHSISARRILKKSLIHVSKIQALKCLRFTENVICWSYIPHPKGLKFVRAKAS